MVFVGGGAGTVARAAVDDWVPHAAAGWPWATFAVNMVGTAILAVVVTRLSLSTYRRPLVGIGFCGALTTFSTLQIEVVRLLKNGHAFLGISYLAVSIAAGMAVIVVVTKLARKRIGR